MLSLLRVQFILFLTTAFVVIDGAIWLNATKAPTTKTTQNVSTFVPSWNIDVYGPEVYGMLIAQNLFWLLSIAYMIYVLLAVIAQRFLLQIPIYPAGHDHGPSTSHEYVGFLNGIFRLVFKDHDAGSLTEAEMISYDGGEVSLKCASAIFTIWSWLSGTARHRKIASQTLDIESLMQSNLERTRDITHGEGAHPVTVSQRMEEGFKEVAESNRPRYKVKLVGYKCHTWTCVFIILAMKIERIASFELHQSVVAVGTFFSDIIYKPSQTVLQHFGISIMFFAGLTVVLLMIIFGLEICHKRRSIWLHFKIIMFSMAMYSTFITSMLFSMYNGLTAYDTMILCISFVGVTAQAVTQFTIFVLAHRKKETVEHLTKQHKKRKTVTQKAYLIGAGAFTILEYSRLVKVLYVVFLLMGFTHYVSSDHISYTTTHDVNFEHDKSLSIQHSIRHNELLRNLTNDLNARIDKYENFTCYWSHSDQIRQLSSCYFHYRNKQLFVCHGETDCRLMPFNFCHLDSSSLPYQPSGTVFRAEFCGIRLERYKNFVGTPCNVNNNSVYKSVQHMVCHKPSQEFYWLMPQTMDYIDQLHDLVGNVELAKKFSVFGLTFFEDGCLICFGSHSSGDVKAVNKRVDQVQRLAELNNQRITLVEDQLHALGKLMVTELTKITNYLTGLVFDISNKLTVEIWMLQAEAIHTRISLALLGINNVIGKLTDLIALASSSSQSPTEFIPQKLKKDLITSSTQYVVEYMNTTVYSRFKFIGIYLSITNNELTLDVVYQLQSSNVQQWTQITPIHLLNQDKCYKSKEKTILVNNQNSTMMIVTNEEMKELTYQKAPTYDLALQMLTASDQVLNFSQQIQTITPELTLYKHHNESFVNDFFIETECVSQNFKKIINVPEINELIIEVSANADCEIHHFNGNVTSFHVDTGPYQILNYTSMDSITCSNNFGETLHLPNIKKNVQTTLRYGTLDLPTGFVIGNNSIPSNKPVFQQDFDKLESDYQLADDAIERKFIVTDIKSTQMGKDIANLKTKTETNWVIWLNLALNITTLVLLVAYMVYMAIMSNTNTTKKDVNINMESKPHENDDKFSIYKYYKPKPTSEI